MTSLSVIVAHTFFGFSSGPSTGPPAFFQAPKPPSIWATGMRPMRCAVCAARAERNPPAQKNTKRLSAEKNRLVVGAGGVNPKLQHSARTVEGAGYPALARQFADNRGHRPAARPHGRQV